MGGGGEGVFPQIQVNGLNKLSRGLFMEGLTAFGRDILGEAASQPGRDFLDKNVMVLRKAGWLPH